MLNQIVHFQMM